MVLTTQSKQQVDLFEKLFENGHGVNLTLYNPNVLKEGENEQQDLGKLNQ